MTARTRKQRPSLTHPSSGSRYQRFLPRLRQSMFARAILRHKVAGARLKEKRPNRLADVANMLRQVSSTSARTDIRDNHSVSHSEVLFEALEPRILMSADVFVPPPAPDAFDGGLPVEEVVIPPSELDEEIIDKLPDEELGTLDPSSDAPVAEETPPTTTLPPVQAETSVEADLPDEPQVSEPLETEATEPEVDVLDVALQPLDAQDGASINSVQVLDSSAAVEGRYTISFNADAAYSVLAEDGVVVAQGSLNGDNSVIAFSGVEVSIQGVPVEGGSLSFNVSIDAIDVPASEAVGEVETELAPELEDNIEPVFQSTDDSSLANETENRPSSEHVSADVSEDSAVITTAVQASEEPVNEPSLQIVFVDTAVQDYQSLLDQLFAQETIDIAVSDTPEAIDDTMIDELVEPVQLDDENQPEQA
ncbi:MAG: LEPR-XLL domain-containing protein, partial [Arenicellales bacterium]